MSAGRIRFWRSSGRGRARGRRRRERHAREAFAQRKCAGAEAAEAGSAARPAAPPSAATALAGRSPCSHLLIAAAQGAHHGQCHDP